MKRDRNARKELLDLYLYLDFKYDDIFEEELTPELVERFNSIKDKYDKKFENRMFDNECYWTEYYGLFKLDGGKIGIDPKRMNTKLYHPFTKKQLEIMNRRNTTYFHPKKKKEDDYFVNCFVHEIDEIIYAFKNTYKPIIDKSIENIKNMDKLCPGDYDNLQMGISGPGAAQAWANWQNMINARKVAYKKYELYTSLYAQFFHYMTSRIEAKTVELYSRIHKNMKDWNRGKLYDNININGESPRDLDSYKYHDELYLIWNFSKHNNLSTYEKLKKKFPEVLIDDDYISGDLAIHYLKLNEKLILDILNGTKQFFIDWCRINLNEDYYEAQWNYEKYFTELVYDEIENIRNPLGLQWWDELD